MALEPRGGIEPPTPFLPRTCSTAELSGPLTPDSSPERLTPDGSVAGTLPGCFVRERPIYGRFPVRLRWWRGQDSNLRTPSGGQIYSLVALTAHPPLRESISWTDNLLFAVLPHTRDHRVRTQFTEPQRGLEPLTCRLQIDCATIAPQGHWFWTSGTPEKGPATSGPSRAPPDVTREVYISRTPGVNRLNRRQIAQFQSVIVGLV